MNQLDTHLGRGVRGLDSRERTLLFVVPFTRFRDVSRDLAPPTPTLLGERSLHAKKKTKLEISAQKNGIPSAT